MSHLEEQLSEAPDDVLEVPDEETVWDLDEYVENVEERDPVAELVLLSSLDSKSLNTVLFYAMKFFSGVGWPELEEKIKDNSSYAYVYAEHVIEGRFPDGEKAIARDPRCSFLYARDIIRGRFPEGEEAIACDPTLACSYATDIVEGRFPIGEEAIASKAWQALLYAKLVMGGRFPEGEEAIYSSSHVAGRYEEFLRRIGES